MRNSKLNILGLIGLLFYTNACTSVSSHAILGPDGTENEIITCVNLGMEVCYNKAREICGGNYKIINSNENSEYTGKGTSSEQSQLLVKCDSEKAIHPVTPSESPKPAEDSHAPPLKPTDNSTNR